MEKIIKPIVPIKIEQSNDDQIDTIIISPHCDDECIGTYEIISNQNINPIIIYTTILPKERKEEALKLRDHVNIKSQFFVNNIPSQLLKKTNLFYFPHPIYETHPDHRLQGMVGEQLARQGFNVTFYITEMTAPFKFECKTPEDKELLLNKAYPSQQSLWEYEKKYILFGGFDKWVFL